MNLHRPALESFFSEQSQPIMKIDAVSHQPRVRDAQLALALLLALPSKYTYQHLDD